MKFWFSEMSYFFKKIVNKDELIKEILDILNSAEERLSPLEARKLKGKLDIFLEFRQYYYFS